MSIKHISFWANRFQELDFGQFVIAKFTFVISIVNFIVVISIKWDFDPIEYLIPIAVVLLLSVWCLGRILEKKKFRQHFFQAKFKDVKIKQEGKDE